MLPLLAALVCTLFFLRCPRMHTALPQLGIQVSEKMSLKEKLLALIAEVGTARNRANGRDGVRC